VDSKNDGHLFTGEDARQKVNTVACYLLSKGLKKNNRVVIMLPTGPEFVAAYFGTIKAGGMPVTVSHPTGTANIEKYLDHIQHIMKNYGASFFITFNKVKILIGGMISPLSGVLRAIK
jgi:fatty-acyl-CoA synthase